MERFEELLLSTLSCAIRSRKLPLTEPLDPPTRRRLIHVAAEQAILPLIVDALPAEAFSEGMGWMRRTAQELTVKQAASTAEFLLLYGSLARLGLRPAVMKGIVCRSLYPEPELRPSTDEDLLIPPEAFPRYHEALLSLGLQLLDPDALKEDADEVTYVDDSRGLYLELHMRPFPSGSEAYGDCNRFFDGAPDRAVELPVYGVSIRTLGETDHLLFLLCHAYKHLLHGGVGVRQLCDIALFVERFGDRIDWERVIKACAELRLTTFAAAVFRIGEKHLGVPAPDAFPAKEIDELPLLEDCLRGGVYGADDRDRLHSSTMTLEAVEAEKTGRKMRGALHSLFLPAKELEGRFRYLRRCPWLLPVAWTQRAWGYLTREKASPARSVRIGQERIALLRQYEILP